MNEQNELVKATGELTNLLITSYFFDRPVFRNKGFVEVRTGTLQTYLTIMFFHIHNWL